LDREVGGVADGGHNMAHRRNFLTPIDNPFSDLGDEHPVSIGWVQEHASMRAVVENVFGRVSNGRSCTYRERQDPVMQAHKIVIVFWLVNEDLKERPLRADGKQ